MSFDDLLRERDDLRNQVDELKRRNRRDFFAASALPLICTNDRSPEKYSDWAKRAFLLADFMIREGDR